MISKFINSEHFRSLQLFFGLFELVFFSYEIFVGSFDLFLVHLNYFFNHLNYFFNHLNYFLVHLNYLSKKQFKLTECYRLNYQSFELLHVVPRAICPNVQKFNSSNGSSSDCKQYRMQQKCASMNMLNINIYYSYTIKQCF